MKRNPKVENISYQQPQDGLMDHWKLTKSKDVVDFAPFEEHHQMKGFLNHWKLGGASAGAPSEGAASGGVGGEMGAPRERSGSMGSPSPNSIQHLINSADVDIYQNDFFSFSAPPNEIEIVEEETDSKMEVYDTPPNHRRLSDFESPQLSSSFPTSPRPDAPSSSPAPSASPAPSPFQSFRITSDGITEVVQSPASGRRFRLTKEGIKEVSSARTGFSDLSATRKSPNLSTSPRSNTSPKPQVSEWPVPSRGASSPFAGMPGAVPPIQRVRPARSARAEHTEVIVSRKDKRAS
eukprot:TRINITY_DN2789_c1_g3_i2.p1 TRINITY_DN2789_c1_g3~~TRINITY_DN2789_c1_g3_i2.p1  ORF type:complete len:293 (-),score=57.13 TRINITY_DN2789_c1_g3_i2:113-991(-)